MGVSTRGLQLLYDIKNTMEKSKEGHKELWEDLAKYVNPAFSGDPKKHKNVLAQKEVFDNTAMKMSGMLADGVQGYSFGRSIAWFRDALEDEELGENDTIAEWLQLVEKHKYRQLAKSSFYDEGRLFVKSGADFGTAIMVRYEDDVRGIPCYKTQNLNLCTIGENIYGEVDVLFRDAWLSPQEAVAWFGEAVTKVVKDEFDRGAATLRRYTQFIFPEGRYDVDADFKGKPFVSIWATDDGETKLLHEGGFDIKPFFVWRWSRDLAGGVWGVDSPGYREISNIRQMNIQRKDLLRIRQLAARPPIKATESLRGRLRIEPNAINYLRAGEDFLPGMTIGDKNGVGEDYQMMQNSMAESYYVNFFLLLSQNIEKTKTATEVAGLQGEQAAMMTAFYSRLHTEFLEPVIEDLFDSELRAGRLPEVPVEVVGKELRVDMISPLALMQKRYLGLTESQRAMAEIAALANLDPGVLDNIDMDNHVRMIAEEYNMDKRSVRDFADVEKIRIARAEREEQMMQMQLGLAATKVQADAYRKTTKAPEPGSLAEAQLMGGIGGQAGRAEEV